MIGLLDHFCSLEHQFLLSAFKASSGSNGKHGLSGLAMLPCHAPSLTELPCIVGPLGFCAHGPLRSCMHTAWQGTVVNEHTACAPVKQPIPFCSDSRHTHLILNLSFLRSFMSF